MQSTRIAVDAWTARHASTAPLLSMQRAMHMHSALPVASKYRHRDHRTAKYGQQRRLQSMLIAIDAGWCAMHKHSAAACLWYRSTAANHRTAMYEHQRRLQWKQIAVDARTARPAQAQRRCYGCTALCTCTGRCLWRRSTAINHRTALARTTDRAAWRALRRTSRLAPCLRPHCAPQRRSCAVRHARPR